MADFIPKSLAILGRQPEFGLAEVETLYSHKNIKPIQNGALLSIDTQDIDFSRLGGTIKLAKVLTVLHTNELSEVLKFLNKSIPMYLPSYNAGKFNLGISFYNFDVSVREINKELIKIKRSVTKDTGRSIRIVPNKKPYLSSAQVLYNKLTTKGSWELIAIKDVKAVIVAQSIFVQDINRYAARDQERPKRDPKVGMLPPKLAQILINLSTGELQQKKSDFEAESNIKKRIRLLDPFCGTGVVLQEALLMDINVLGTDINPRMVEYSKINIRWLFSNYPNLEAQVAIEAADATKNVWPRFSAVATELDLGKPLMKIPSKSQLNELISVQQELVKKFLINLSFQLKPKQLASLALPAWRQHDGSFYSLPIIGKLPELGYNLMVYKHLKTEELIYHRPNQIVGRQIITIKKA